MSVTKSGLTRLMISYCANGGSSRGTREFVATSLDALRARELAQVEVVLRERANRHPFVLGTYTRGGGVEKQIGVKNLAASEIAKRVLFLASQTGRRHVKLHEQTSTVISTQGVWTPSRAVPVSGV